MDIDNVKINKKLGAGMFGTTYLVNYKDKEYAMKIQHILPKHKKENYKYEIWRELDLYKYINKLPKDEQEFFTKLYYFDIVDDCKHKQERPFKARGKFAELLAELDKSKVCSRYIIEYKGKMNLHTFLIKHKVSEKCILSFMLQICKIILILYKGGYSHADLHGQNIMVNPTTKKYFYIDDKKVPYYGYQLSAIDYGLVLHNKFDMKLKGNRKLFLEDREKWMFNEIFYNHCDMTMNIPKMVDACKKANKILPWERKTNTYNLGTIRMIKSHPDFIKIMRDKYLKVFSGAEKLFDKVLQVVSRDDSVDISDFVRGKKEEYYFWDIINRIVNEFMIYFPDKFSSYWKWCSVPEFLISKNILLDIQVIDNYKKYIEYLYMCINKN